MKLTKTHLTYSLYGFGMILYALIFLLGISNMAETKRNTEAIKLTTSSTNKLVAGQSNILNAIKKVTQDTQLTAQQQTSIIICMLQVPQPERTTDIANDCRKQATAASSADTPVGTAASSAGNSGGSSSGQSVPQNTTSQATPSQSSGDNTPPPPPGLIKRIITNVKEIL